MDISLNSYVLFWVCIIGLCLGSFFNVVILRSLSNESIAYPPSKCPKCNNRLKPWHNIPVLSYVFLRGKCGFCKEKISIQYPLVELTTMALYALTYLKFGNTINTLFLLFIISGFIIMTVTDIKEKVVDCNIAITLALVGILWNFLTFGINGVISSFIGLVIGVVILELIARSGYIFIKSRAMGEADTYVAGSIGACFGVYSIIPILIYGLLASMIFIIPQFMYNEYRNNHKFTSIMMVVFLTAILTFKVMWQNYWMVAVLMTSGILLCISILRNIKTESNRSYLPYVPALVVGALYFIFFEL